MLSDTHSIETIHRDDLQRIEESCFEFFRISILSALAVPDVLEAESPIAISYDQIHKLAVDTWSHFGSFFRPVRRASSTLFPPQTPRLTKTGVNTYSVYMVTGDGGILACDGQHLQLARNRKQVEPFQPLQPFPLGPQEELWDNSILS